MKFVFFMAIVFTVFTVIVFMAHPECCIGMIPCHATEKDDLLVLISVGPLMLRL